MELDVEEYADSMHRILTTVVTPRPIGWISTRTAERDNLAPFSYYNATSTWPPTVMFAPGLRNGEPKDSRKMAVESGEFVANLVTEDLVATMDLTSASLGEVSEFTKFDIEREEAVVVDAPRVADAAACLECTVYDTFEVYDSLLIVGDVKHIYINERLTDDGVIDMRKVDSVGRIGGPYYTGIDILDQERQGIRAWEGPAPPGFFVEQHTQWLKVDEEDFEAIRQALVRIEDGQSIDSVIDEVPLSRVELKEAIERAELYLDGKTSEEEIEFALSEAGIDMEFVY